MLSLQLIILSYTKNLKYVRKGVFDLCNNIFTLIPPSPPKTMEDKTENNYCKSYSILSQNGRKIKFWPIRIIS
jgi:hypothetical protein